MKKICLLLALCSSLLFAHGQTSSTEKSATVYTTADKTNLKIAPGEKLNFKPFKQPLETEVCVFIDPAQTFQTFIGIGGAITDASAETFAKLSKAKQQEF